MLRQLIKYLFIISLLITSGGCNDGLAPGLETGGDGVLSISLYSSKGTRSTESNNNEVTISNLIIALFPSESNDDESAVALETFSNIDTRNSYTANLLLTDDMIASLFNNTSGSSCRIVAVVNIDNLSDIKKTSTVNELKNLSIESPFSTVKAPTSFVMYGEGVVKYTKEDGASKGSADGSVDVYRTASKISLNIFLPESVDVKDEEGNVIETWVPVANTTEGINVLLNNGVDKCIVSPSNDWTPSDDDINNDYFNMSFDRFGVYRSMLKSDNPSNPDYPYQVDVPLYTYPNEWEESPEETHKTVMTLRVPWQKVGEDSYTTYYYQVPVTDSENIISNHHYIVNLSVNMLGSVAPETPQQLNDLSYKIVEWGEEPIDVNINNYRYLVVNPTFYNVYNEEEFQLPFYTSHSVEIESVTLSFDRFNFYSNGNGDVVTFNIDESVLNNSVYVHTVNNVTVRDTLCTASVVRNPANNQMNLRVKHPLEIWNAYSSLTSTEDRDQVTFTGKGTNVNAQDVQNTIRRFVRPDNPESPYSAYTITVVVKHADNDNFKETVTIKQYPGMYIEADRNEGGEYATGRSTGNWGDYEIINGVRYYSNTYSNYGFVYVNPTWHEEESGTNYFPSYQYVYPGYWENSSNLGDVHGLTGGNKNPNMYVITVSQLSQDDGDNYIIGDPRLTEYNNNLNGNTVTSGSNTAFNNCVSADALYTGNNKRKLTYYLPTHEGDENTDYAMMIGPKIRIASSWGVTNSITKVNARRRAATYQEQGYPAGRWRLPTLAEFTFITKLSATGKIPHLFTVGSSYWTAQGAYSVDSKGVVSKSNSDECFIRSVYDEWYWNQFADTYQLHKNSDGGYDFTFGDLPRKLSGTN